MASTSERNQSESDMDCDEIICDLSDTSDTEIYSYHDTDSEQNLEPDEELPNDDSEFYFGKDGVIKWKKTMWQKTQIRTRSVNIISQLPGPKSEAKLIESESDAFTKIIDNDMVQKIVDCTNAYISKIKEHFSRERDAKLTTVTEILALFGLLIMSGVKRAAHLTYKELWAVDGSGVEIVRAIMSQERFLFLLPCLRFDDITTRKERKKLDKLAPIREFVEAFVYNCKKLYTPGEYNTIDEKPIPFRGRCGFRQYMPNKPAKYGLKIYTISDARTFYTFNFEIYCGKQPDGPYKKSNSPDGSKRKNHYVQNLRFNSCKTARRYGGVNVQRRLPNWHFEKKIKRKSLKYFCPIGIDQNIIVYLASLRIPPLYLMSQKEQGCSIALNNALNSHN
ncbi:hypothetical protein LAZ67_10002611 [Cordylochernes scorpioides]|uniref:PiggyBac transposable element-derived protein domain-containing protein n=1 Tax=Cordylochernes scorpioides TaxID=51811 RepID=A0ABY6KWQ3_9ARAC|nr:hypothetical protein LAZ67_10002611 [Cordylochernes scorpioides]